MAGKHDASRDDPHAVRLAALVELWWSEAGRYNVLPLDDRLLARLAQHAALGHARASHVYDGRVVRMPIEMVPLTLGRSWSIAVEIEVPEGGADGPIVAMGGDTSGWSLYLDGGVPTFCYNFAAVELTYIRGDRALGPGRHVIRYEFEIEPRRGDGGEPDRLGAGGRGRLYLDQHKIAEGDIPRTMAYGYSLDETFDIGCDKGSPVTGEYWPLASFTGEILRVVFDTDPDVKVDAEQHHAAQTRVAMVRQ
jgi:arylsulfatase